MLNRQPEIISHRGLHDRSRENTLAAFEQALEAGAEGIELDVHATADGKIVVHHDPEIGGAGAEQKLALAANSFQAVKVAASATGFDIPLLAEVLDLCRGRATAYIEVKAPGIEIQVAREIRDSECDLAIHAFDHRVVRLIRDLVPGVRAGILTVSRPVAPASLLSDANATDYWPHFDFVDEELVGDIHDAGGRVIAWTANAPEHWARLAALAVDGICTDRPDSLKRWLLESETS